MVYKIDDLWGKGWEIRNIKNWLLGFGNYVYNKLLILGIDKKLSKGI